MHTRGRRQERPPLVFERVVDAVKEQIAAGTLMPGDGLPSVEQLAAAHSVGVSSVREALRVLGAIGVVRIEHGRGSFVAEPPPSPPELRARFTLQEASALVDLAEARRIVEPELAALACERGSTAEVAAIKKAARRMAADLRSQRDWLKADVTFHEAVCEAAHNEVLAYMFASLAPLLLDSRRASMRDAALSHRAAEFHVLIAGAIERRRTGLARAYMLAHLEDNAESFSRLARNGAGAR
jgi:GntR family transcriptional repressor for pyruvate dehydrogenase complex